MLLVLLAVATIASAQVRPFGRLADNAMSHDAELHGTVLIGSRPAPGANVQLQNLQTGVVVAKTETDQGGAFSIANLEPGDYLLTTSIGLRQEQAQISVATAPADMQIRFADDESGPAAGGSAGANATVSATQLLVSAKARHALADAEQALGKRDSARAEKKIAEALEASPKFPEALTLRAAMRLSRGETEHAIGDLDDAVRIDPNYPPAYFLMGTAYNAQQRFDDAERAASQGLRLAPRAWQGHYEIAKSLMGKGEAEPALKELDATREVFPANFAEAHLLRGVVLIHLGRYGESEKELDRFLQMRPDPSEAERARQLLQAVRMKLAQQ
jgi:tetratricopeptide (TPR) repeat protein